MLGTVEAAVAAIRSGQVVGLPTDTVYGIGVDPLNDAAVARLYELKGRPGHKPVGLLVASIDQAREIGVFSGSAEVLARKHWPGALTLVVRPAVIMADWVGDAQRLTVGIRVPDHPIARRLLSRCGPLAVTSANRSGGPEVVDDVAARAVFDDEVAVYLQGTSPGGEPSTVVDVTQDPPLVLRRGPVVV